MAPTRTAGAHAVGPKIARELVYIGERQVHYRIAGRGAPVVLLHQSPRSSAELEPLMRVLAPHFLVIAPDTPGFGQSHPVAPSTSEPTIDVFADALIAFLDALGLERVGLFGSHTGAIVAVRVASRYPGRIAALVPNGILLNTADERSAKADRYLPPFVPQWDGGHLAWMWSRLRDQLAFYPWYEHDPGHRIDWQQSLAEIEAAALDLMESGDDYRGAYGAVLHYGIGQDLVDLEMPTLLVVAKNDALSRFVAAYPALPPHVEVSVVPDFPDVLQATLAWLRRQDLPPADIRRPAPPRGVLASRFVELPAGRLHVRSAAGHGADNGSRPIVVLPEIGGSVIGLDGMLRGLAGRQPLCAIDLPGCGESERCGAGSTADIARILGQVLDALGIREIDVVAIGTAAPIGLALHDARGVATSPAVLIDPILSPGGDVAAFARALVPDLTPDSAGSHLLRGWMHLRDRALYFPWHDRSPAAQLPLGRIARPVERHRALLDLLKAREAHAALLAATLGDATPAAVDAAHAIVLATPGAAIRRSGRAVGDLPDERFQWGAVIRRVLRAGTPRTSTPATNPL